MQQSRGTLELWSWVVRLQSMHVHVLARMMVASIAGLPIKLLSLACVGGNTVSNQYPIHPAEITNSYVCKVH